MGNIEVKKVGRELSLTVNDMALIRRYEKVCSLDEKKIAERVNAFLSSKR